jgi:hypothetical protein
MSRRGFFLMTCLLLISLRAGAGNWSGSVGYNNPPGANIGLNFMYLWSNWAFEFGLGNVSSNNNSTSVGGDIGFKYLFRSGVFRPYLQFGAGSGVSVTSSNSGGAGASVGGGFGGAGIFLLGNPIYAYGSYNVGNGSNFYQVGIGYDF